MSANTKQVLAITLGSLGLVLGIIGTITAYNAKNASTNDADVTKLVQDEFNKAQSIQDAKDEQTRTQAQQFVDTLGTKDKKLVKSINTNAASISKNKQTIASLKKQTKTLHNEQKQTNGEISDLTSTQKSNYNNLNNKINQTNANVAKLQKQVRNLNQDVKVLLDNP